MAILSIRTEGFNWTDLVLWEDFQCSIRQALGATATIRIDCTGITDLAPQETDRFTLTVPTGEKIQLDPIGVPETLYRSNGRETVIVYTYECIDPLAALDRRPLPVVEYFESTSGEILRDLISQMDDTLDTSGIEDGNSVPYLTTEDFSRFSDIVKSKDVSAGGFILQLDPSQSEGLMVLGNYRSLFPASGLAVDYTNPDFSPFKEEIVPDNDIINYQKVRGNSAGGPHHKMMEFRELDAFQNSFQLGALPYGLDGVELLNEQFDGTGFDSVDSDSLPKVVPLHHPVTVEVSDINPSGSGEICSFTGRGGTTILGVSVGAGSIGAIVDGASVGSASLPITPGGQPVDIDHQYSYDWYAEFFGSGLRITVTEYYLDATAGQTTLATITAVNGMVLTLSYETGKSVADLPNSLRLYTAGDPEDVLGFVNIVSRDLGTGQITVDVVPEDAVGAEIASGDDAQTTTTDEVIYSGAAPTKMFGKPVVEKVSGSGVTARAWVAQYGCPVQATLLANPYTGAPGRPLKVNTIASRSADLAVSKSGNTAVCQFVSDRLPLTGAIRLILNYDVSKRAEAVAENAASQAEFGIRAGEIIDSEYAITEAECSSIAEAVVNDRAFPPPKGTIDRESILMGILPVPNKTFHINVAPEYRISTSDVPIAEVSMRWAGGDPETQDGVLMYTCTLGSIDTVELINRQLLTNEHSFGTTYRPITISGPVISGATWDDVSVCSLSISGGSISIAGRSAGSSFDPAAFAPGNLRAAPVKLKGTVSSGDRNHELMVEVIYPPSQINEESVVCHFNARRNEITFNWAAPDGGIEYRVQRQQDPEGDGTFEYTADGSVFYPSFSLSYTPQSKKIKVQVVGLADKVGGDYVELTCVLPALPAPSLFEVVKVRGDDTIVTRVSAIPTGRDITGRTKFIKLLVRRTDPGGPEPDEEDYRAFFANDDDDVEIVTHPISATTGISRYNTKFTDTEKDDVVWIAACWVDLFGDEGDITEPFDATRPPLTVGSIELVDFFQSAAQASGGVVVDDDEQTTIVEFSGVYRVHLGRHNKYIRLKFEESLGTADGSDGAYPTDGTGVLHADADITDDDVLNGYVDIVAKQKFRSGKRKQRTYRPTKIVFEGVKVRERLDASDEESAVVETLYLIGLDPFPGTLPPAVPYSADGYFDKDAFKFKPWNALSAAALTAVTIDSIAQKPDGFRLWWKRINEVNIRRYMVLIHTAAFGTLGPGTTADIGDDLDALDGRGTLLVYNAGHSARDTTVYAVDAGDTDHYRFHNDDVFGGITVTPGVAYYVSVIAQTKSGRWCTAFSTVFNTLSGAPATGDDADVAVWVNGAGTIITDPNSVDGLAFIKLRVRSKPQTILVKVFRPNAIKSGATTGTLGTPHITRYGVRLKAGDGSSNWLDPETPGTPITSEGSAEFFLPVNDNSLSIPRSELASIFKTAGFIASIRPYNFVAGVETAGTFTSYTSSATTVVADPAQDTEHAGAVVSLTNVYRPKPGYRPHWLKPTSGGINNIVAYYMSFWYFDGVTTHWMNVNTGDIIGTSSGAPTSFDEVAAGFAKRITNTVYPSGIQASEMHATLRSGGLKVRVRAVNIQNNVETYSTTTADSASFLAPIAGADTVPDIGVPSGGSSLASGPVVKFKGGLKIAFDMPTVNMNTFQGKVTCFVSNTAESLFWNPITNVTSGSPIEFAISPSGDKFPFLKTEMAGIFTTFKVWYRVYNVNVTGTQYAESAKTTYSLSGADFAEGDSGVPATPSAPAVQEIYGAFISSTNTPGSSVNTIIEYQQIMSTQSTAPAGTPTVGSEGVQRIKYGQTVQFRRRLDVAADLYFYTRVKNENGYSSWSTGTQILAADLKRPSFDTTGDNVVTLLQTGDTGSINANGTGATQGTPMKTSIEINTGDVYIWFFFNNASGNYFSLTEIEVELKKKSNLVTRFQTTVTVSEDVYVVIPFASLPNFHTVRCRMRNGFRNPAGAAYVDPGADVQQGWSAWSYWVDAVAIGSTFDGSDAGSGITPQAGGDYQQTLPTPYTSY